MTLRLKLVLAFMVLATAALAVGLSAANLSVEKEVEQKVRADLARTVGVFQQRVRSTLQGMQDFSEATARDRVMLEILIAANSNDAALGLGGDEGEGLMMARELILSADLASLRGATRNAESAVWALFNAGGQLVYTKADARAFGLEATRVALVQEAREGRTAAGFWTPAQMQASGLPLVAETRPGDLVLALAQPVGSTATGRLGVLLTGRWIQPDLLEAEHVGRRSTEEESASDSRARFVVLAKDGTLGTAMPPLSALAAPGFSATGSRFVRVKGSRYLVREGPLPGVDGQEIARGFVVRDFEAEVAPFIQGFRNSITVAGGIVLLLAASAAFFLARRLSAPLVALEAAARQVRLGNLEAEVTVRSSDEVGRVGAAFNEMLQGLKQRDQIKGLFKRYLDPHVVDELIRHPEKAAPGGERKVLTVLFSDLVGFTALSEKLGPEVLVAVLNTYFEQATEILAQRGATLDKFIGDAIMCFWNAPLSQEDHAHRACLTALDLIALVERLGPELAARGVGRLDCRIGINTGACVAGNIGSARAQEYTVIGDAVNLASRLEAAAKVYGTRTLVSEDTVSAAGGRVPVRELDWIRVQGRHTPVRVYELLGSQGTAVASAPPFAEGLALYRSRSFQEARAVFASSPEDAPSRIFAHRCEQYLATPPPDAWDGVWALTSK